MSIFETSFYQKQGRSLIATFGSIFNDLEIVRQNKKFRVPIGYGTRAAWIHRFQQGVLTPEGQVQLETVVPRMSYTLKSMARDPTRTLNRLNREQLEVTTTYAEDLPIRKMAFEPVPWNYDFELSIYTNNMDDMLAITEQIQAYFNPSITVRLLVSSALGIEKDVAIDMQPNVVLDDNSENGCDEPRIITTDMSFTAKSWIYGPIKEQKVIIKSIVETFDFNSNGLLQTYTAEPLPGLPYDKNRSTVVIEE